MTNTPKTIREWLQQLPEPYQSQAVANVLPTNLDSERAMLFLATDIMELDWPLIVSSVVKGAFDWKSSNEGADYWATLCLKLDRGESLI